MSRDFSEVILSEDEGNSTTQISLAWSTFGQGPFKDNLRTQWISKLFFFFLIFQQQSYNDLICVMLEKNF